MISSCFAIHEVVVHDDTCAVATVAAEVAVFVIRVVYRKFVRIIIATSFAISGVATARIDGFASRTHRLHIVPHVYTFTCSFGLWPCVFAVVSSAAIPCAVHGASIVITYDFSRGVKITVNGYVVVAKFVIIIARLIEAAWVTHSCVECAKEGIVGEGDEGSIGIIVCIIGVLLSGVSSIGIFAFVGAYVRLHVDSSDEAQRQQRDEDDECE